MLLLYKIKKEIRMSKLKINVKEYPDNEIESGNIFYNGFYTIMIIEDDNSNYFILDLSHGKILVFTDNSLKIKEYLDWNKYKKVDAELSFKYYKD